MDIRTIQLRNSRGQSHTQSAPEAAAVYVKLDKSALFFTHPTGKIAVGGGHKPLAYSCVQGIFGTTDKPRRTGSWFNTAGL